ncbi:MAG TPA: Maf family protein [Nitrospirota bacterium]|nr:Maf family protein [Nitrospirota bacterium]
MPEKPEPVIILASNSPRRSELLRQIGLSFVTAPSAVDEQVQAGESPESYAVRVALDKARAAAARAGSGVIIAADTIVVLGDRILGKPADRHDAELMLSLLSGRMHVVITGLAVIDASQGKTVTGTSLTRVWFRNLSQDEIASYVMSGEPLDKAGAYGIQGKGALFVDKIEGCYFNVVGLPLSLLGELLGSFNIRLF